jgi:hypothetical protein
LGGLVHTLVEGTDAGQLWFIALVAITSAPVFVLLGMRVSGRRVRAGRPAGRSALTS